MDQLVERVAKLEVAIIYERQITNSQFAQLEQRMASTPTAMVAQALGLGGWLKLLVAIILPLLVWWMTGDIYAAKLAGRLSAG